MRWCLTAFALLLAPSLAGCAVEGCQVVWMFTPVVAADRARRGTLTPEEMGALGYRLRTPGEKRPVYCRPIDPHPKYVPVER